MEAAIATASQAGAAVTIAIVDAGGHLILLERMEGGKFHTVHSATTKATPCSRRRPGALDPDGGRLSDHRRR
jgi:glc operon protein GlcG